MSKDSSMSSSAHASISEMGELIKSLQGIQLSGKSSISLEKTEPDYVLDIDAQTSLLSSSPIVAATSSNFAIRLFSKETLSSLGVISGHTDVISGVRFCKQNKHLLFSSSQDSVKCWDLRASSKAAQTFEGFTDVSSITSFDLSCNGRVLCAGSEVNKEGDAFLTFWDRRHGNLLGCYSECHQDDITQVEFHPSQADSLLSASTDGLVCVYDISQSCEDEALISTLNSCSSVQKIGWCGAEKQNVYCVTHIDTFHVWNAFEGDNLIELTDIKERTKGICKVEYVVDCIREYTCLSNPVLLTGTHSGTLHLLEVDHSGEDVCLNLVSSLTDGHSATVRCQHWDAQLESLVTGAEDSLLCLWSPRVSPVKIGHVTPRKVRAKLKSSKSKKGRPY